MTDLPLPPSAGRIEDMNHPRSCLVLWHAEAERMTELSADPNCPDVAAAAFRARASALNQCAQELENRLRWSGMLEE